jgi:hypothetical protein
MWWRSPESAPAPAAEGERRALTWLLVGGLLSLIPFTFMRVPPAPNLLPVRTLVLPGIGLFAGLGTIVSFALSSLRSSASRFRKGLAVSAGAVAGLLLVLGPIGTLQAHERYRKVSELPPLLPETVLPTDTRQAVVLWWPRPDGDIAVSSKLTGRYPDLDAFWHLTVTRDECRLTRVDDHHLVIETNGAMFPGPTHSGEPIRTGYEVTLRGLRVRVLNAEQGVVKRVDFEFEQALDAPGLVFLAYRDGAVRQVALPATGQTVSFASAPKKPN